MATRAASNTELLKMLKGKKLAEMGEISFDRGTVRPVG